MFVHKICPEYVYKTIIIFIIASPHHNVTISSLRLRVSDTTVTISEEETCGLVSRYHSPTVVSLCDGSAGSCRDSAPQLRLHHGYWSGFDNCNNVYKSLFKIFSCLYKETINVKRTKLWIKHYIKNQNCYLSVLFSMFSVAKVTPESVMSISFSIWTANFRESSNLGIRKARNMGSWDLGNPEVWKVDIRHLGIRKLWNQVRHESGKQNPWIIMFRISKDVNQ